LKQIACHANEPSLRAHPTWRDAQEVLESGSEALAALPRFDPLWNAGVCGDVGLETRTWTAHERRQARKWFRENVAVYVLKPPARKEPRNVLSTRLLELQIPFQYVHGVDLREDRAFEEARAQGLLPPGYNLTRALGNALGPLLAKDKEGATPVEWAERAKAVMRANASASGEAVRTVSRLLDAAGAAVGHFRAQERALNVTPSQAVTLVLEDEAFPAGDFMVRLWSLVTQELPCDWQVVSLAARCPYGRCVSRHLARILPDAGEEQSQRCRFATSQGLRAFAYRTREMRALQERWKDTVFDEERPSCLGADAALASIADAVAFYAVPVTQHPRLMEDLPGDQPRVDIDNGEVGVFVK
jgi:hypothetical protein